MYLMPDTLVSPGLAEWLGPAIMLLDLDAFFASVEQLDHPEWRGKPVIVGGDPARRGVVSTCSYEARRFGVRSAMPSATAARLCPDAIWTPGNFPRYIEMSKAVMQVMRDVSPRLSQVSIDEAFLDVSPGRYVREHPVMLATQIAKRVDELGNTCSIGLGSSQTVAKVASDQMKPQGLTVVYPGGEASFLAPLPIRSLSGIGPVAEGRLAKFGVTSLGQMAQADPELLREVFGANAEAMRQRCLGIEASHIASGSQAKSVSNEMTFSTDLTEADEIKAAIEAQAAKVGRRLRSHGLRGHTVTLKLRYADLSSRTAQKSGGRPLANAMAFTPIALGLLPQLWRPGDKVRLVGVAVSGFDAQSQSSHQPSLFEPDQPFGSTTAKQDSLAAATDRVRDRFGECAVAYGRDLRFSHRGTGTPGQRLDDGGGLVSPSPGGQTDGGSP
jgi:DNA polymerase-4